MDKVSIGHLVYLDAVQLANIQKGLVQKKNLDYKFLVNAEGFEKEIVKIDMHRKTD